jgi:aryl-alcohol dehydrogenase-like predicted oxidoreductase
MRRSEKRGLAVAVPVLRELGIAMTAYSVLSRGLLTRAKLDSKGDVRAHLPRFAAANAEKNAVPSVLQIVESAVPAAKE